MTREIFFNTIRRIALFTIVLFGIVLFLPFCTRLSYDIVPHQTAVYHSLALKVNVKNRDNGRHGNFKILLKYDESRDKMLFLSPLNQVYGLLLVEQEKTLLIDTKKKRYWRGTFNHLVQEIWGLDFNYREFKQLIVAGVLPTEKMKAQNLEISFPGDSPAGEPGRLQIAGGSLLLKIKISDRKTGKGLISFSKSTAGLKKTGIRELLEAGESESQDESQRESAAVVHGAHLAREKIEVGVSLRLLLKISIALYVPVLG